MGRIALAILVFILIFSSSTGIFVQAEPSGRDDTTTKAGEIPHVLKAAKNMFGIVDHASRRLLRLDNIPLNRLPQYLDLVAKLILRKYGGVLDRVIHLTGEVIGRHLSYEQRNIDILKRIVVREHLSRIAQQQLVRKIIAQGNMRKITIRPVLISSRSSRGNTYNIYYTPLTTTNPENPYPIEWWVQTVPDVDGGWGWTGVWPYWVNGHNNLYLIDVYYNETTTVYVLHYQDEDHPNPVIDRFYDKIRQVIYGGIEDVESFYVKNDTIVFPDIWDNNKPYAYPIGQHGYMERAYTPQTVIYVSNVWNHAMDVLDKNPSLDKIIWHYGVLTNSLTQIPANLTYIRNILFPHNLPTQYTNNEVTQRYVFQLYASILTDKFCGEGIYALIHDNKHGHQVMHLDR